MTGFLKPSIPSASAAAAPATPAAKPKRLSLDTNNSKRSQATQKRKGRNALKIDLQAGTAGADGTGLNIPRS